MEPSTAKARWGGSADMAGCGIAERRRHHLRLERAGGDRSAADQNSRDARNTKPTCLGFFFGHRCRAIAAFQKGARPLAGETSLLGNVGQNSGITNVPTLG